VERRQLGRSQSVAEGLALFILLSCPAAAGAQPAVTGTVSNATRVESWSYFQPKIDPLAAAPDPVGDPDYTFVADRAELGVRVDGSRFDFGGAFNYVRLENLPTRAIGPGALGTGALYFAATGVQYSYQLYLGELTLRIKSSDRRASLSVGRMPFSSGGEYVSANAALEQIKRARLQSRLVGNFEFSLYQRRFDGARVDLDRGRWHFTAAGLVPTQGGFEESSNLSMPRLQIASVSATRTAAAAEHQAFALVYRDRRPEKAVVDNTFSFDRGVDVTIATAGASSVRLAPVRSGEFDALAWGAVQFGDWYGRPHRAAASLDARAPQAVAARRPAVVVRRRQRRRPAPRHLLPDAADVSQLRAVDGGVTDEPARPVRAAGD
jgi:hypothetical protein